MRAVSPAGSVPTNSALAIGSLYWRVFAIDHPIFAMTFVCHDTRVGPEVSRGAVMVILFVSVRESPPASVATTVIVCVPAVSQALAIVTVPSHVTVNASGVLCEESV
jgi:hypothetical protein